MSHLYKSEGGHTKVARREYFVEENNHQKGKRRAKTIPVFFVHRWTVQIFEEQVCITCFFIFTARQFVVFFQHVVICMLVCFVDLTCCRHYFCITLKYSCPCFIIVELFLWSRQPVYFTLTLRDFPR